MTIAEAGDKTSNPLTEFQWTPQPEAEALVKEIVDEFFELLPEAKEIAWQMTKESGTRFTDWIDHISGCWSEVTKSRFVRAGYVLHEEGNFSVYRHPAGIFPALDPQAFGGLQVTLKVDSVADFMAANACDNEIEASPLSAYRVGSFRHNGNVILAVAERHGYSGFVPVNFDPKIGIGALVHSEAFRTRRRSSETDIAGFEQASKLIDNAIQAIGRDRACDAFFAAEREFWMRRNRAAQVQYARQKRLGLGWANHDHHTYRSSREHFAALVAIWEKLGFVCRERFYAGAEAGWGAQVMEHPVTGIVTFNDVDLSPDELMQDFAHEPLEPRKELGTVGLWCKLHGESFLEAGMHHLECMFDFEALRKQLESDHAIKTMKPFTDYPHLRQAFTEGERWKVRPARIDKLLADGRITPDQAAKFRAEGAIGSHLENLERNAGFKGFNQKGVSEIISATDPRKQR